MSTDFAGKEIAIDNLPTLITGTHEAIRCALEATFGDAWHIITLYERSRSRYSATFETRLSDHPYYIAASIDNDYEFEAIEDGPRYEEIDGEIAVIPRPRLYGTAKLVADGKLRIMETSLMMPVKR